MTSIYHPVLAFSLKEKKASSYIAWSLCVLAACDPAPPAPNPDAAMGSDGGLAEFDGTSRLSSCESEPSKCASASDWDAGRWNFHFSCPATSIWEVRLTSGAPSRLHVVGSMGMEYGRSTAPATSHTAAFTSYEAAGLCTATVELPMRGQFEIEIIETEAPLDAHGCDELCLSDSAAGVTRGCDCGRTCHDACSAFDTDCGLPCNRDVPGYECPFLETEIMANPDCTYYERDNGAFEHVGRCYRCGDGQQCCYTDGRDNGSGSFDLCPPLDPGDSDPDPNGCSGVFEHCDCDVIPLCGCMAESGNLELCGRCIGESITDVASCNAPGTDSTFCQRAADAAAAGFSWCAIVGDIDRCFDLPPGF